MRSRNEVLGDAIRNGDVERVETLLFAEAANPNAEVNQAIRDGVPE